MIAALDNDTRATISVALQHGSDDVERTTSLGRSQQDPHAAQLTNVWAQVAAELVRDGLLQATQSEEQSQRWAMPLPPLPKPTDHAVSTLKLRARICPASLGVSS